MRRSITARFCCTEASEREGAAPQQHPGEPPRHLHRGQDRQAVVAAAERPDPDQAPQLHVADPGQPEGARERGEQEPPDEAPRRRRHDVRVGLGGRARGGGRSIRGRRAEVSTRRITRLATSISARKNMCSNSGAVESTERIASTRKSAPKT